MSGCNPRFCGFETPLQFRAGGLIKLPMMKIMGFALLALSVTGCASRFASDPRAAVVGPAYLDCIANNPCDRDTQYYYPAFTVRGMGDWVDPTLTLTNITVDRGITAMLTDVPKPSRKVLEISGKGYPDLEAAGLRLFTAPHY
jgi:hypothetical protein